MEKYAPFIVPHKTHANKVYCKMTHRILNKNAAEIEAHMLGRRFVARLAHRKTKKAEKENEHEDEESEKKEADEYNLEDPDQFIKSLEEEGFDDEDHPPVEEKEKGSEVEDEEEPKQEKTPKKAPASKPETRQFSLGASEWDSGLDELQAKPVSKKELKLEQKKAKKQKKEIGRAVQQECRDRSRMPSSA
eukprot:TRINITY_DN14594_c0_g1_i3.p1 TRINITY_DN14594_c0_g1~~TRINITY_DN14594_c0_g1_i3.p1  ORF type:complete len:190 (+),score=63.92 TRINITY_DN14594_c0_g1_i3:308-877(+)